MKIKKGKIKLPLAVFCIFTKIYKRIYLLRYVIYLLKFKNDEILGYFSSLPMFVGDLYC